MAEPIVLVNISSHIDVRSTIATSYCFFCKMAKVMHGKVTYDRNEKHIKKYILPFIDVKPLLSSVHTRDSEKILPLPFVLFSSMNFENFSGYVAAFEG